MEGDNNTSPPGGTQGGSISADGDRVSLSRSGLRLPGVHRARTRKPPGEKPGIDYHPDVNTPPKPGTVEITYVDYGPERTESGVVRDITAFVAQPRPDWAVVRWINVSSIQAFVVNQFCTLFDLHTLTAEDVLHVPQRPRSEVFDDHIYVVLRMLQMVPRADPGADTATPAMAVGAEQVSLFLFDDVLITFQEAPGDLWQPIRDRIATDHSRIRKNRADYLMYALLDAIVDHYFPILEGYGNLLEDLEIATLEQPSPATLHRIHSVKRELALLRRIVWPMREVVDQLYRDEQGSISEGTRPYLRDVYEHTIQIVEIIESYREMASGLTDLYMSAVSNRMNEIMKVLTIMASVFIPLTFIAGVYGMNFHYMPELAMRWGYAGIWCVFIVLTLAMVLYFRHRGWIGKP